MKKLGRFVTFLTAMVFILGCFVACSNGGISNGGIFTKSKVLTGLNSSDDLYIGTTKNSITDNYLKECWIDGLDFVKNEPAESERIKLSIFGNTLTCTLYHDGKEVTIVDKDAEIYKKNGDTYKKVGKIHVSIKGNSINLGELKA